MGRVQIVVLVLLACWIPALHCKRLQKSILPGTVFLTKFDIGAGKGTFTIKYQKRTPTIKLSGTGINLGLIKDTNLKQFRKSETCLQKQSQMTIHQSIDLNQDKSWGTTYLSVEGEQQQHIWYLYIYNCAQDPSTNQLHGLINLDISMLNNGSSFGEDQNFLIGYAVIFGVWVFLGASMFLPIVRSLDKNNISVQQIIIYGGFLLLGLAYLYRFADLLLIHIYNSNHDILLYLYKFIKYAVQGITISVITSIGWGWSLIHLKQEHDYIIIIGTFVTIMNFIAIILDTSQNELEDSHHKYQSLIGILLFFIRIVTFVLFIVGIFKCMAGSVGKRRQFVKKFGIQGSVYFLGWPLAVIFVEIALPSYMHNQIVTIVQDFTHIFATAHMCHLFAFPNNDFKKVSLKDDDEHVMPDYRKK